MHYLNTPPEEATFYLVEATRGWLKESTGESGRVTLRWMTTNLDELKGYVRGLQGKFTVRTFSLSEREDQSIADLFMRQEVQQ